VPYFENAHALVVGIANYQHVSALGPSVLNDARAVQSLLIDPQRCGYRPENVQLLLDGDATRAALLDALAALAAHAAPNDTVWLYISGHGALLPDGPAGGAYVLPVDADLSSTDALTATAISGQQLTAALDLIPAQKLLVVFDCCHAGGLGQPKAADLPPVKAGLPVDYYEALGSGRGRVILAASRGDEPSWILPGAANSLFTQHLLAGLQGGIASDDGLIRVFDLFEYVQPRVTADQPAQHPLFKSSLEDNFAVALYVGGQKGTIPKDEQGYRYDVYVSFAQQEPDAGWVWQTLLPELEGAGLKPVVSGLSGDPGVPVVVNTERGVRQARRTLLVLSPNYVADQVAEFENVLGQTMGLQEGKWRLLPVKIAPIPPGQLPTRIEMLGAVDLTNPYAARYALPRLIAALQGPTPIMDSARPT
jgi:hypothetical protein